MASIRAQSRGKWSEDRAGRGGRKLQIPNSKFQTKPKPKNPKPSDNSRQKNLHPAEPRRMPQGQTEKTAEDSRTHKQRFGGTSSASPRQSKNSWTRGTRPSEALRLDCGCPCRFRFAAHTYGGEEHCDSQGVPAIDHVIIRFVDVRHRPRRRAAHPRSRS